MRWCAYTWAHLFIMETDFFEWLKSLGLDNPHNSALSRYYGSTDFLQRLFGTDAAKLSSQISYDMWNQALDEYNYNKFESPAARMKALEEAGINRNIAAQGIAGSAGQTSGIDTPSDGVVPTSPQSPIAQAAGVASQVAAATQGFAGANAVNSKLADEILNIRADTADKLAHEGVNYFTALSIQKELSWIDDKRASEIMLNIANYDKFSREVFELKDTYDIRKESLRLEMSTLASEADKAQYEAQIAELDLMYQQHFDSILKKYNYDRRLPSDAALIIAAEEGKKDVNGFGNAIADYFGRVEHAKAVGEYTADPYNEEYRNLYEARNELVQHLKDGKHLIVELKAKLHDGEITRTEFDKQFNLITNELKQIHDNLDNLDDWHDLDYVQGHRKQWQDILNGLLPFGIGMALSRGFKFSRKKASVDVNPYPKQYHIHEKRPSAYHGE